MRKFASLLLLATLAPVWAAQPVRARRAMVVTREANATHAGAETLRRGGNAIDAAVTVGLALAVTHPSAGNLGGGGFMLIRFADGRSTFIDFRERAPQSASRNMYVDDKGKATEDSVIGYRAAGVPGTVRGLEYAAKKYGKRPWAELAHPAVELAQKGFAVSWGLSQSLKNSAKGLSRFPESNRIFLRNGKYYEMGERLVQPELGKVLERIEKQGGRDFYEGETARLLSADVKAHGGHIDLADLKAYAPVERKPLIGSYKGYGVITAPPPSSGGAGILQMLGVLEASGYEKEGVGSASSLHWMAEAMRRYFADRARYMGDPDFVKVPLTSMLDPKYITGLRASIRPDRASPSASVQAGAFHESAETTHYTVADAEGNVVAVTYTLNGGYGSKVTATGLGILLNNEMDDFAPKPGEPNMYGLVQGEANAIQPGKRPLSSMTPTIVLRDGKPYLAVGSPGGPTIINTVLQVIANVIDFKLNVQEAVNRPRIHHQWLPDELRMEPGFSPDTVRLLEQRGHKIKEVKSQGEVCAILFDGGFLQGAPDPRVEATAEGI
jgi:gamma-glutamyltranspeptidase/glutathione hydrolase